MPTSADLLLDTSAAVSSVRPAADGHDDVMRRVDGLVLGLAGHAVVETYSVLTRLPLELRVTPTEVRRIIETNFPASHALSAEESRSALARLSDAGITGGAVYDGLIGLAASSAGVPLLSRDRRAARTYAALGVAFELV